MENKLPYEEFYYSVIDRLPEYLLGQNFMENNEDSLKEMTYRLYRLYEFDCISSPSCAAKVLEDFISCFKSQLSS
jgi:hypothetical protein